MYFQGLKNKEVLKTNLDLLEAKREQAIVRTKTYRHKMARYHNQKMKNRSLTKGDLVMRKVKIIKGIAGTDKPEANREGPYKVTKVIEPGT